jgi:hypothetical protein
MTALTRASAERNIDQGERSWSVADGVPKGRASGSGPIGAPGAISVARDAAPPRSSELCDGVGADCVETRCWMISECSCAAKGDASQKIAIAIITCLFMIQLCPRKTPFNCRSERRAGDRTWRLSNKRDDRTGPRDLPTTPLATPLSAGLTQESNRCGLWRPKHDIAMPSMRHHDVAYPTMVYRCSDILFGRICSLELEINDNSILPHRYYFIV